MSTFTESRKSAAVRGTKERLTSKGISRPAIFLCPGQRIIRRCKRGIKALGPVKIAGLTECRLRKAELRPRADFRAPKHRRRRRALGSEGGCGRRRRACWRGGLIAGETARFIRSRWRTRAKRNAESHLDKRLRAALRWLGSKASGEEARHEELLAVNRG